MSSYYVRSTFDDMDRFIRAMPQALNEGDQVMDHYVEQMSNEVFAAMVEPGSEIQYPVNWDSDKQRRAYFASDGFGTGIPYQRQGTLEGEWVMDAIEKGYEVLNADPIAHYVYGTLAGGGQSQIHLGRWPAFFEAVSSMFSRWTVSRVRMLQEIAIAISEALRR